MGGLTFIIGSAVATIIFARDQKTLAVLIASLLFGAIGFLDDFLKVVKKRNLGLRAKQKMALQILSAGAFVGYMYFSDLVNTYLYIPIINKSYDMGVLWYFFAMFAIVAIVNSVNLTDGIDGLASSVSSVVFLFFTAIGILFQSDVGILAAALCGGCLGFLIFNFHPAKMFMGDTGSLFLGGAVAGLVFIFDMPMIFLLVGFMFFLETLSVAIQVTSFKLTGKRVFKMSPIHHHFEMSGWKEEKIVYVFTLITILTSLIAFFSVTRYFAI